MNKNLNDILIKIQSDEITNLYDESIEIFEFFEKDNNDITFLEHCLKHNIEIGYLMNKLIRI